MVKIVANSPFYMAEMDISFLVSLDMSFNDNVFENIEGRTYEDVLDFDLGNGDGTFKLAGGRLRLDPNDDTLVGGRIQLIEMQDGAGETIAS